MYLEKSEKNGILETGHWYWEAMENKIVENQIHLNVIQNSAGVHAESPHEELPHMQTV